MLYQRGAGLLRERVLEFGLAVGIHGYNCLSFFSPLLLSPSLPPPFSIPLPLSSLPSPFLGPLPSSLPSFSLPPSFLPSSPLPPFFHPLSLPSLHPSLILTGDKSTELSYMHILNNVLPDEIRVLAWAPVGPDFSARFSCLQRTYKYFFPRGKLDIDVSFVYSVIQ